MVQSQPKVPIWLTVAPAVWGLELSCRRMTPAVRRPFFSCVSVLQQHSPLPGTHYSVVLSLTQHCAGTACTMEVVRPTTNEEGCLWTPHQFYVVPRNKMGKLNFRLSYVSDCIGATKHTSVACNFDGVCSDKLSRIVSMLSCT
jgi:hypothetical protein